jgi:ribosomal protein S18 acetylase RimI-like enzyme
MGAGATKTGLREVGRVQAGNVRKLERPDRARIEEMIVSAGTFNDVEIKTALELVDEALEKGDESGYLFALIDEGKGRPRLRGYACYGPTPLTQGTYDLYWIVVSPEAQQKGWGRSLLEQVERDVVERGGRMLLIETSSQEIYGRAVDFYRRNGYRQEARIRDFYRIGDDKLIFSKELALIR